MNLLCVGHLVEQLQEYLEEYQPLVVLSVKICKPLNSDPVHLTSSLHVNVNSCTAYLSNVDLM
jgi:hypothetical protein